MQARRFVRELAQKAAELLKEGYITLYEYNTEIKEREEEQKQHMKHMSMIFEWELSVIAFNSHFSVL